MGNLLSTTSSCEVIVFSKYDAADMAVISSMVLNRKLIVTAPSAGSCWCYRKSFHSGTLGSDICNRESDV